MAPLVGYGRARGWDIRASRTPVESQGRVGGCEMTIGAVAVWGPWLLWAKVHTERGLAVRDLVTLLLGLMGARVLKMPEFKPRWEALEAGREAVLGIGNTFRRRCGQLGVALPRGLEKASAIK